MRLYSIEADGRIYEVEGPDNAPEAQLFHAVRQHQAQEKQAELQRRVEEMRNRPAPKPETTVGGNIKELFKGVIPGGIGLVESAGTGLASLLPEDMEQSARDQIKEIAGIAKKPFAAAPGYEDSYFRKVGEGLGSFLPMAPLGFLGIPGIAAGVGVGLAAGAGESRERAEQGGASADQRRTATQLGVLPGGFDAAVDMALAALPGGAGRALGFIRRALMSGGIEGATEAAQEIAQNAIAKGLYKPDQSLITGAGESGAVGAGAGVLASLLLDMAIPGRRRGAAPTPAPAETPPEQPPLLLENKFKPVVTPEGQTLTRAGDLEQYERDQPRRAAEREQDRRTSDPLAGLDKDQQELARSAKEAQLREAFARGAEDVPVGGQRELDWPIERPDGTVEIPGRGRITPRQIAETPEAAPTPDTQTRDMIAELEAATPIDRTFTPGEQAAEAKRRAALPVASTKSAEKSAGVFAKAPADLLGDLLRATKPTAEEPIAITRQNLIDLGVPKNSPTIQRIAGLDLAVPEQLNTVLAQLAQLAASPGITPETRANLQQVVKDLQGAPQTRQGALQFGKPAPEPDTTNPAMRNKLEIALAEKQKREQDAAQKSRDYDKAQTAKVIQDQLAIAEAPAQPELEEGQTQGELFKKAEPAAQPAAKPEVVVPTEFKLTDGWLDGLGVLKQAPIRKQLLGKNLFDPADRDFVRGTLVSYAANPNVKASPKRRIDAFVQSPIFQKQGEMFGPRGGVIAPIKETKNARSQGAVDTGLGAGAPSGAGATTAGAKPSGAGAATTPKAQGLAVGQPPAGDAGAGKGKQSTAVKTTPAPAPTPTPKPVAPEIKAEPKAPEVKAEPKAPEVKAPEVKAEPKTAAPKAEPKAPEVKAEPKTKAPEVKATSTPEVKPVAKAKAPEAKTEAPKTESKPKAKPAAKTDDEAEPGPAPQLPSDEYIAKTVLAYQEAADEIDEPRSVKAVAQLLASKPTTPEAKAAKVYFGKRLGKYKLRVIDALKNIAFDIVYDTTIFSREKANTVKEEAGANRMLAPVMEESPAELQFLQGMNAEKAKLASKWVADNLDEKADAAYAEAFAYHTDRRLYEESSQYSRMMLQGVTGRSETDVDTTVKGYYEAAEETRETTESAASREAEERANMLLIRANKSLSKEDTATLEEHYKATSDSDTFYRRLRTDILSYVNKGAASVSRSIRRIIHKLAVAILSVGVVFNQGHFVQDAQALSMPLPKTEAEFVQVVEKPRADFGLVKPSATAATVADWIVGTKNAKGKPFQVLDKPSATVYVFDAAGKLQGAAPVLMGATRGADVVPQSAINKTVAQTAPDEKVTPAGRFEGQVNKDVHYGSTFDFLKLGNSVLAMHKTYLGSPAEGRQQRLDSPTAADNFISYGCVNVDTKFYKDFVESAFQDGGVMYITPMTQSLEQTFAGISNYSPTQTIVTSIITNPTSLTNVQAHSEIGDFRKAPVAGRVSKAPATSAANPNEFALGVSLSIPLHPAVVTSLNNGDFKQAMGLMAQTKDPRTAKLAERLLAAAVNPKVEVVDDLRDEMGAPVAGLYNPKTNTIRLDSVRGMSAHTLIHETGHAALSHVLADKNNPVTKQMQKLLDDVSPMLDTAYGAQDVQEFAAEALGNPEFRGKLHGLRPDGGKVSAWARFQNIVGNFFRRLVGQPSKPLDSALDKVDRLIDTILSPAPDSRDAGMLYSVLAEKGGLSRLMNGFNTVTNALPRMTPERKNSIHEFITNTVPDLGFNGLLRLLPLEALQEQATRAKVFGAKEIGRLVALKDGVLQKRHAEIDAVVKRVERWGKEVGPEAKEKFSKMVLDSTIAEVDPTKPEKDYAAKPNKKGEISPEDEAQAKEDIVDHRKLAAQLNALPAGAKETYVEIRDAYKAMFAEIKKSLESQIDEIVGDAADTSEIKDKIFRRLIQRAAIDPYFPLHRQGSYALTYNTKLDGQVHHPLELFETERGRNQRVKELMGTDKNLEKDSITTFMKEQSLSYAKVPPTSFVGEMIKVLERGVIDTKTGERRRANQDQIQQLVDLFVTTLPEASFAKSLQKRKKTPGYEKDVIGVFAKKLYATSHQVANIAFARPLNNAMRKMDEETTKFAREEKVSASKERRLRIFIDEYRARVKFINNPSIAGWSRASTGVGFNMLLGANISTALIQLAQVPMVTLPFLGGEYGYAEATKELGRAMRAITGAGRKKTVKLFGSPKEAENYSGMFSLDNMQSSNPDYKELKPLIDGLVKYGQTHSSLTYDLLEASESVTPGQKINRASGWMLHQTDRINRQVTLLASYRLEMARLKSPKASAEERAMSPEEMTETAVLHAIHIANLTQGGSSAATAPRITQNNVGRILFMYKKFGLTMMYAQIRMLRDAFRGETPEIKRQGMRQFGGMVGIAALMAGVQGVPFFGAVAAIYNLFKDDDEDDLEMATRRVLEVEMSHGLVSSLTGYDVSGRISLTDLLVREMRTGDRQSFPSAVMEQAMGPLYGIWLKGDRGFDLMRDGYMMRGLESVLPTALGNPLKSYRFATEGALTLRGDPIMAEVSTLQVLGQALGFSPSDYQRQNEVNSRKKGFDKYVTQTKAKLSERYYIAGRMGDTDTQEAALEDLRELYQKHPSLGSLSEYLTSSMRSHMRTTGKMEKGIVVSDKLRGEIRQYAADFDDEDED